ncbi:hypothetical protein MNBD_ALPHA03-815 [hydrothermal vent metagenome]|uniref:Lnb N-terminal periplasmic domain-containing protein n=1 Tax=hydrothermal vent metagenome TaxID=652676 RepID=A0A3B1AJX7_9ZZZZ
MSAMIVTTLLVLLVVVAIGIAIFLIFTNPSLSRDWSPDQALMPSVDFINEKRVRVKNIRNINYRTTRDYDLDYYDKEFDLDEVISAWLAISPFGGPGAAHAFLSFGLKDGSFIAVSIEIRRKKGQRFSPVKAFMRQFEIMYVIADETDVIRVRTNCVKYTVRLFPVQTEKALIQQVFLDVLKRADKLGKDPEFYNTVWNNCTTNIIRHTRRFSQKPIPFWNIRYLLPDSLDKIAYRLNIIDTHLSYDAAREHFDITKYAQATKPDDNFSTAIRNHLKIRPVD